MAIAVDEAHRGNGIGRSLLTAAENWSRECGCIGIRLSSGFERVGAHEFYQRCGYINRKQQKNFIKIFVGAKKTDIAKTIVGAWQ
jgi:GNAT superfamily N-acetyltransferase